MENSEKSQKSVRIERTKPTPAVECVDGGGDVTMPLTPSPKVVMTPGSLMAIQQQQQQKLSSGQMRKVRDELDPAPHHTPADIKVLEILKRIRDEGNVGDEDPPPPKRKPGRSKMTDHSGFVRQTPPPVLPQPVPSLATTNATSVVLPNSLDSFKVPISATISPPTSNLRPKSVSSTPTTTTPFRPNGTSTQTIFLTAANGTSPNLVTPGASLTLIQQKPPATTQSVSVAAKPQQIELILPNGIRIPVSATTCAAKPETKFTPISAAKTGSLMSPPVHSISATSNTTITQSPNQTTSTQQQQSVPSQASSTASTSSNTQQICSCSRSKCLKLYCDCFAAGRACGEGCNCRHCYNNLADDETKKTRDVAVKTALSKNPMAFKPKIEDSGKHVLGCRCKRSHCSKGYCECYLAKIPCNQRCRCLGCSNDDGSSSNPSSASSNTSASSGVKTNDVQLAIVTPTQMQQLGIPTTNAVSSLTASPLGVVKANILPANTDGSTANASRTFTLNWPVKTLTTANGTANLLTGAAAQQSTTTTSTTTTTTITTDVPSIIFSQSFLTAVANQQNSTSVQQDLLKCLSSVLPQATVTGPQLIIPSLVQGAAGAATAPSTGGQVVEGGQMTSSQSDKTSESQNGDQTTNGKGNDNENADNYTGYTEEELIFLQRLQENRNHTCEENVQIKNEYPTEIDESRETSFSCPRLEQTSTNPHSLPSIPDDITIKLNSVLATLLGGSQVMPTVAQQRQQDFCQTSEQSTSMGTLSPQSAPPSLCPPSGAEERLNMPSRESDEVRFLKQKVSILESQITHLRELTRTQGEVMSQLSNTVERLQQQNQTMSPVTSQASKTPFSGSG